MWPRDTLPPPPLTPPVREPRAQREVLTAASPMPCLPGHSCTGPPTMASDHQTPAGKPQPLNPKVGTMWEEGVASTVPLPGSVSLL